MVALPVSPNSGRVSGNVHYSSVGPAVHGNGCGRGEIEAYGGADLCVHIRNLAMTLLALLSVLLTVATSFRRAMSGRWDRVIQARGELQRTNFISDEEKKRRHEG